MTTSIHINSKNIIHEDPSQVQSNCSTFSTISALFVLSWKSFEVKKKITKIRRTEINKRSTPINGVVFDGLVVTTSNEAIPLDLRSPSLLHFVVHCDLFLSTPIPCFPPHTPLIHSAQKWNENPVINTSTIPLHGVYCVAVYFIPYSFVIFLVHHHPTDPKDSNRIESDGIFLCGSRIKFHLVPVVFFGVSESKKVENTKKVCRTFFDLICN